ncbi:MAG: hypothetical protein ACI9WU_001007 [Myxococcota bacterium]|jgi:hypothetical protein
MKRILSGLMVVGIALMLAMPALAAPPASKSKFYDFSDQLIDGEIRKPTALFTDARQKAKFDRLLSLKKSFLPAMFRTSKEKVFK